MTHTEKETPPTTTDQKYTATTDTKQRPDKETSHATQRHGVAVRTQNRCEKRGQKQVRPRVKYGWESRRARNACQEEDTLRNTSKKKPREKYKAT